MEKNNYKNKSGAGFTLIEIMVAITVFSIIISSIAGIFVTSIKEQRKTLTSQVLLDQTSYILEYMSRSLRMARKQISGETVCLPQRGLNYEIIGGGTGIRFINQLKTNDCEEFYLEDGKLKYKQDADTADPKKLDLTSDDINITSLKFILWGNDQDDDFQPSVTLFLEAEGKGGISGTQPKIQIQTTISQRMLDVIY